MKNKQYLIYSAVFLVLAGLVYLQFRSWQNFEWSKLWSQFRYLNLWRILFAIGLTYFAYILRALRWKVLLRPVRKNVSVLGLIPPTLIGFTGLSLLGRPGELIRPYLIARRENLNLPSQLAVWAVERIFDFGGFALLLLSAIFLPKSDLHSFARTATPEVRHWILLTGDFLIALVVVLLSAVALISYRGNRIAQWIEQRFSHLSENLGHRIAQKVREFANGLDTIHGPLEFLQLSVLSVLMWSVIAFSYKQVTLAYGDAMAAMSLAKLFPVVFSSMLGSMVQLPGVGGGSQLATIVAFDRVFGIPREVAVSCGIMLWLVNFVAVVPVGLLLAHRERLSLRKLSKETAAAEEAEPAESTP